MYHFLHKHRFWFVLLTAITAAALALLQFNDDVPVPLNPPPQVQPGGGTP